MGSFVTEFGVSSCSISLDGGTVIMGIPGCECINTLSPVRDGEGKTEDDQGTRRESLVFGDAVNKGKVFGAGTEDTEAKN